MRAVPCEQSLRPALGGGLPCGVHTRCHCGVDGVSSGHRMRGGGSSSSGSDNAGQSGSDFTGSAYESSGSSAEHRTGRVILGAIAFYGVMPVAVLFIGFMLGGMAARWNHERSLARAELAHRRQQERTAQDIHDYVSNDLAYLILRFDKNIADGKTPSEEELRELRSVAMGALDRTHQVIDVIEGRGEAAHSAVTPHDSTVDAASGIATARAFICPTYALTLLKEGKRQNRDSHGAVKHSWGG